MNRAQVSPGDRFGRWTVSDVRCQLYSGSVRPMAICVCDCGTERAIMPYALLKGQSTQCRSCSNLEKVIARHAGSHHGSETRLYSVWCNMRRRCGSAKSADFHRYGARGIKVCAEWNDFVTFRAWAEANGYAARLTLDRRDNNCGYEPNNCRWVDRTVQNRNRRDNLRFDWRGQRLTLAEISELEGVSYEMLRQRVRRSGWPLAKAVAHPPKNTWNSHQRKSA